MNVEHGRAKGGFARAQALSAEERSAIAARGAQARWRKGEAIEAICDGTLRVGELELPCAVLPGERRVLSETGVLNSLGMYRSGAVHVRARDASGDGAHLPLFVAQKNLLPFVDEELASVLRSPIWYLPPNGGGSVHKGVDAGLIPKICDVWLKARDAGVIKGTRQTLAADRADMLMRGLAHVGIIALVDEATGFQDDRPRRALAKILEAFIAKELQPWVQTFPADYYREIFRLRGLNYQTDQVKRPKYFGILTNDIVYKRLAPGVLAELKRVRQDEGRPRDKLFQRLTQNIGYPKLREHLGSVVTIMKLSDRWGDFNAKLDRLHPRYSPQMVLPLEYQQDDGRGL